MEQPRYRCTICGKESDPNASNEKRSIGMHIRSAHDPDGSVEEYREEIPRKSGERGEDRNVRRRETGDRREPRREQVPRERSGRENIVYIVQGECSTEEEAKSRMNSVIREKPGVEEFAYSRDRYIFFKCSTERKAEEIADIVESYIPGESVNIFSEPVEEESESGPLSFLGFLNPFSSSGEKNKKEKRSHQRTPAKRKETQAENAQEFETEEKSLPPAGGNPGGKVIGRTVSTDDYRHFIDTKADSTTMEGLMQTRQQIAKGEGIGGRDPMKWVMAIIVLMIGLGVAFMIFGDIDVGSILPGIGGAPSPGGGGGTIP